MAILGRLERQDLRDVWTSEASNFTPWLARSTNLALLGEALGLSLELEAQERAVGSFLSGLTAHVPDRHIFFVVEQVEAV